MSEKNNQTPIAANKSFAYRNIKKDFTVIPDTERITKNYHLELGEKNECVIVEDRNDDWELFQQQNLDQVGLANIIALAQRRGEDPYDGRYSFKDDEAMDLGDLDPKDLASVDRALDSMSSSSKKLVSLSKQLGVSVDDLIDAVLNGTINELVTASIKPIEKGGEDNA